MKVNKTIKLIAEALYESNLAQRTEDGERAILHATIQIATKLECMDLIAITGGKILTNRTEEDY